MFNDWTPLQTALNTGTRHILEDQRVWVGPIEEFGIPCTLVSPIKAELNLLPQDDGLLVRGKLSGKVCMPCNRCTEDAVYDIRHEFDSFEPFPVLDEKGEMIPDPDVDEYFLRLSPLGTGLEINLAALAWEEFAQILPVHPLCTPDCAGLCAQCGQNLNLGACGCVKNDGDPRLARLRGLKIDK